MLSVAMNVTLAILYINGLTMWFIVVHQRAHHCHSGGAVITTKQVA